jgi:hypothetical protein
MILAIGRFCFGFQVFQGSSTPESFLACRAISFCARERKPLTA